MTDKIVVLSTCATDADAQRIARTLVEGRLAACVSIAPGLRSIYRWQGALENSEEVLLLIKTSRDLFPALKSELERIHPYEVPEILALPVVEGSGNYLAWVTANLRPGEPQR
ncbi:MAG TPA: divalent-cation tolerance protein CutA [Candidatus Acidoferrales bacterium]|nr:divalent-cation tolerance protein CutA [Candidatus Acidoferrales bacterium]